MRGVDLSVGTTDPAASPQSAAQVVVGAWLSTPSLGIVGAGWAWLGAQMIGALLVLAAKRRIWPPDA